jgi:hypothetical protein
MKWVNIEVIADGEKDLETTYAMFFNEIDQ